MTTAQRPDQLVVVVEDDRSVREMLAAVLDREGYDTVGHASAEAALADDAVWQAALVVLDVGLPGADGIELCRILREGGRRLPILMVTARYEVSDRVIGLDAGADDYLVKPFALDELLARVRSCLRRVRPSNELDAGLELGDVRLDRGTRLVTRGDRSIALTRTEFDLLAALMSRSPRVVAREVLHEEVWGTDGDFLSNSLEVFVSQLRRKLEDAGGPRVIHTVRGVGYVAKIEL